MAVHHGKARLAPIALGLLALLAIGCNAPQARAQSARVERLEIVKSGFYVARKIGLQDAPGTAAGTSNTVTDVEFLESTPAVTAKLGTRMGVRFRVVGSPRDREVQLRAVWLIPEPGLRNPDTGNIYRRTAEDFTAIIGGVRLRGYGFDKEWEVVKGRWTLQIWQGERKLLEKSFLIQ